MKLNDKFKIPMTVTSPELVFGGKMDRLLPSYKDLPDEFRSHNNKWCKIHQRWFFSGLPEGTKLVTKTGINKVLALRHIKAINANWEPKHEHKESGVAYLLSLWFDDIIIPEKQEAQP